MIFVKKKSTLYDSMNLIRQFLIQEIYRQYKSVSNFCAKHAFTMHDRTVLRLKEERWVSIQTIEEVATALGYTLNITLEKNQCAIPKHVNCPSLFEVTNEIL